MNEEKIVETIKTYIQEFSWDELEILILSLIKESYYQWRVDWAIEMREDIIKSSDEQRKIMTMEQNGDYSNEQLGDTISERYKEYN